MNKRRLSEQQQERIDQRQRGASNYNTSTGVVIAHYGTEVDVATINDSLEVDLENRHRCHFRANLPTLVCGDRIKFQPPENRGLGVVESILPRESVIERPRPYQDPKPVATNIDTVVLVIAPEPEPIGSLIDRYLVAAENARLDVIMLLNKYDLYCTLEKDHGIRVEIESLVKLYRSLGYKFYFGCSSQSEMDSTELPENNPKLNQLFNNRNCILVGQSGVGKSSIINAVVPASEAAVGETSAANIKGRHTTTTAQLYFLPGKTRSLHSGIIIDSPGIREFGLWHLDKQAIVDGMPEFRELATRCKFRDCDHEQSAGCAILKGIDDGTIHSRRVSSYRQILESLQSMN